MTAYRSASAIRRWLGRFPHRRGLNAAPRIRHLPDCAVLGPGGPVGGGAVRFELSALRLDAQQKRSGRSRLAHHGGGPGAESQEEFGIAPVLLGEPQAVHRTGIGGDVMCGEVGLVGIDGHQAGNQPGQARWQGWAMAALSRRARSSGVSVTGGGSIPRRVWTSW